jgi:branched-chain amino acid transport system ATP-binding protein
MNDRGRDHEGASLVVTNLVAGYGAIEVLHGVSMTVEAGQAVAIVGANGAGKTTLLRAISGLLPATKGSIELSGRPTNGLKPHQIARLGVGHVPEGRQIFQRLTVRENLFLGTPEKAGRLERLERQLETFQVLRDKLDQPGGQLSGGQQQMLAIARALMSEPKLLLLDEPSLGLSPKLTEDLCELLARVRSESRATFVLVEQNIALAAKLTDQAVLLQRGDVIGSEASSALIEDSALLDAYLA